MDVVEPAGLHERTVPSPRLVARELCDPLPVADPLTLELCLNLALHLQQHARRLVADARIERHTDQRLPLVREWRVLHWLNVNLTPICIELMNAEQNEKEHDHAKEELTPSVVRLHGLNLTRANTRARTVERLR